MHTTGHCLRVLKTGLIAKGKVDNSRPLSNNFLEFPKKTIVQIFMKIWKKKEVAREGPMTLKCARNGKKLCFWIKKQYVIHAGSHSGHQSTAFSSQHRWMLSFPPGKCRHYSKSGSLCSSVQFVCLLRLDGSLCFWLIPSLKRFVTLLRQAEYLLRVCFIFVWAFDSLLDIC